MKGTCYTTTECTSKGGTSGGNCAAGNKFEFYKKLKFKNKLCKKYIKLFYNISGFGVCCMFT